MSLPNASAVWSWKSKGISATKFARLPASMDARMITWKSLWIQNTATTLFTTI